MVLLKRIGEGLLLATLIFLLFIIIFENRIHLPAWLHVVGRMHPMFLHFPIVLLLIYLFTLWLPAQANNAWVDVFGLTAALTATITAIMGFILSMEEVREGSAFTLHKWGGISTALLAAAFYYQHKHFTRTKLIARPLTVVTAVLVFLTGHWGGELTHGENYLFEPFAGEEQKVAFDQAFAFDDVIKPIFKAKCFACHSASNKKGGLSLEDSASVLEGGKAGLLYIAGQPDTSLLIKRIILPLDHKKHMVPKSKPQLSQEEIKLLYAWIKTGAPLNKKVINLPVTDSFRVIAANFLSPVGNSEPVYDFPAGNESKIKALNNNYRIVVPLAAGSSALTVKFYGRAGYSPKAIEELLQLKQQITELSAANLPVKDEDLKYIRQLSNLRKLNLNNTDVTDRGVDQLSELKKLQELSLSGTKVTAASLERVAKLPELTSVFIWNTKTDANRIAYLQKINKKLKFETGYVGVNDTTKYTLNPPTIKTPEGIFEGSTFVEVKHGVRGVEIRYSLDGSTPDSIKSPLYRKPLRVQSSVTLKVKAYKSGWRSSEPVQAVYVRKGLPIDSIELSTVADGSFNPKSTNVLNDGIIGKAASYRDGKWFGFKKNDGDFLLQFEKPVAVRELWLILNSFPLEQVFPATSIDVWGGMDKNKLKLLSKSSPIMPVGFSPATISPTQTTFPLTTLKYIKVVLHPLLKMPKWHFAADQPSLALLSEVVVN